VIPTEVAASKITEPLALHSIVVHDPAVREPVVRESRSQGSLHARLSGLLPGLMAAACVAFGLALIANTHPACDGGWYWCAVLHHSGSRLYRDLHLVLQPLAVLETEWWMDLAGKGWMVSKIPAVLYLIAFATGIACVTAKSKFSGAAKAVVIACVFFVGIFFEGYRFDDYHVMTDVPFILSILLLLRLGEIQNTNAYLRSVVLLGLFSGCAIMTRITDGAVLCLSTALAIACLVRTRKAALLCVFAAVTSLVVLGVIFLTGDTLRDYATSTIFHAAGPKGGVSNLLSRPLLLLWNTTVFLGSLQQLIPLILCAAAAASWAYLVAPVFRADEGVDTRATAPKSTMKTVGGLVLFACAVAMLWPVIRNGDLIIAVSAVCVIAEYGIVSFLAYKLVVGLLRPGASAVDLKPVILFLPFGLLLAGSLSSGGYHFGLYGPVALFILAGVVLFPLQLEKRWLRSSFLVIAALMAVSGAYRKTINPFSWHSYQSYPMFSHRLVIDHPTYGKMIIDDGLHTFAEGVCSVIASGGKTGQGKTELLSIPFPYANYYCDIPPWQGFVQTFFDTTSKETIDDMMAKLDSAPPQWILYQRQLGNLAIHEKAFNNGKRLPQRDLDEFIVRKTAAGKWHLAARAQDRAGTDWFLINTQ